LIALLAASRQPESTLLAVCRAASMQPPDQVVLVRP
jgi:hypothetical protein